MSKGVHVREFLKFKPIDMFYNYRTDNKVIFEDNIIILVKHRDMILTRYLLEVLECYPELPIVSDYLINNFYSSNGMFTSKTINNCFETMLKDIVLKICQVKNDYSRLNKLYYNMYKAVESVYNEVAYGSIEYSSSSSILDYLEIQMDPRLLEAIADVDKYKNVDSINHAYAVFDDIVRNDPKYRDNPISKAYIAGMINANQIKQILGPRGYLTEIDGSIFKYPIASSFTLGMKTIYDLAIESRSGAKALFLSNKAVQDSEYLARELQLVTMVVEKLVKTDCGNRDYINWYVRPSTDEHKGDLGNIIGKRYLDDDNVEKIITKNDKHLEGKTIKLRSVLNCKLKHKGQVCSHCFGELSYGVFDHSNLGHYATATITQKITQSILSTKHLTTSATTGSVKLEGDSKIFFTTKDNDGIAFKPGILTKGKMKHYIVITQEEAFGLKDIRTVEDIPKLDITRVSRIESMVIIAENDVGRKYFNTIIKDGNKYGSFTHKFLEYIVNTGYKLDSKDRYVIDVSGWKYVSPIILMPQLEFSFLELSKTVKKLFKYIKVYKTKDGRASKETPESLLQKFFDLINSKLNINIALMEVMIYAFTIKSMADNNYELARNVDKQEVTDITHIMPNRSMGGNYAWEDIAQSIVSASSFRRTHRMNHPLDVMLKPNEVVKEYSKR